MCLNLLTSSKLTIILFSLTFFFYKYSSFSDSIRMAAVSVSGLICWKVIMYLLFLYILLATDDISHKVNKIATVMDDLIKKSEKDAWRLNKVMTSMCPGKQCRFKTSMYLLSQPKNSTVRAADVFHTVWQACNEDECCTESGSDFL